jgi:pimeloyl-ACP methyl ester carboxylesterase
MPIGGRSGVFAWFALVIGCAAPSAVPRGAHDVGARREGTSSNGLRYVDQGIGSTVVLVHAFQSDLREWDEVAPLLAASHRVIRYDGRGHGRSADLVGPTSATDDLRQLLDDLGVSKASIAGLSMGSEIALDFAIVHPDRVDRVVMVSPSVGGLRAAVSSDWVRPIVAAIQANDQARAATLWWHSPLFAGVRARGAAAERYRVVVEENTRIWSANPAHRRPLLPPAAQRLAQVTAPVLVITGEADARGFHDIADTIVARTPGARAETMAGAGHMISMEQPEELAARIGAFLAPKKAKP